jgi:cephalosporin-C deacetylase-like acetyl esterase
MFRKEDVRFPAAGGIELSAWLFVPERRATPLQAITMVRGYAGTKYHGLVVLLHDHRGFGDSGGELRHDVNPRQQIADWRRAISYLQDRPEVDQNRVGLWGTGFAGGFIPCPMVSGRTKSRSAQRDGLACTRRAISLSVYRPRRL